MDELLAQFLIEGPELVHQGVDALLALERHPGDSAVLNDGFRAIHTLKGSVGLFDLPQMAIVLHAAEDRLSAARSGQRPMDRAAIGLLLTMLDQTQAWLDGLSQDGALPGDAATVARQLAAGLTGNQTDEPAFSGAAAAPAWAAALRDLAPAGGTPGPLAAIRYTPDAGCYFSGDDPLGLLAQTPGLLKIQLALRTGEQPGTPYDPFHCNLLIEAVSSAPLAAVQAHFRFVPGQVECVAIDAPGLPAAQNDDPRLGESRVLRIDAARVESLASVVDELVAAKSGLGDLVAKAGAIPELAARFAAMDRMIGQVHRHVAGLRMTPVRQLLRRFPRVVRDLSETLGKDVELVIEGGEVEADRQVVDGLFEPLTHLLRNAIDHGVEPAEARLRAGKPARAIVTLAAAERRGLLSITVRDDGSGIDPVAMRDNAARKRLLGEAELAALSDAEAIDLIFLPGFSTAESVTSVSGRGVGMDAIRTAVRRLGGRVGITTRKGGGTSIELRLPLTVSLTQVMVAAQGQERFGLPLVSVIETLRLAPQQIIPIRAGHAFKWRDQAIPLLSLASLTGAAPDRNGQTRRGGGQHVLVVRTGSNPVGIAIDAIEDRLDVAVRPLQGLLAGMPGLSGAAVMGDGQVLMILDPEQMIGALS